MAVPPQPLCGCSPCQKQPPGAGVPPPSSQRWVSARERVPPQQPQLPAPWPRMGSLPCPHPRILPARQAALDEPFTIPGGSGNRFAKKPGGKAPAGPAAEEAFALPPGSQGAEQAAALPRPPFAGSLRWEEKLSSFPRSPTHFNELSGGTPPRRLPRIRPPGSLAPFKEASGGGWTLAGLSAWPRGWALPSWAFLEESCDVPSPTRRTALSPSGNAGSSRPASSHPQALMGRGKFDGHVS